MTTGEKQMLWLMLGAIYGSVAEWPGRLIAAITGDDS